MTEVFANTYTPPEWLDQRFLQEALREGLRRGSLQLLDCKIRPATNVGDNFVSQMFRASTTIGSRKQGPEDLSIVIKSLPKGDAVEKFVRDTRFFEKETTMLSETLPILQKILEEAGGLPRLFAKLYYLQGPPNDLLIMEDLCQGGFRPANRLLGLDFAHSVLVVESLATFHAASLVAVERHPDIKEKYDKGFWNRENSELVEKFVIEGIRSLAGFVKEWENIPEGFSEKLLTSEELFLERMYKACDRKDDDLNVLTHGDSWTNNFMFKYANDAPIAVKLVDFQISFYGSPVFDLMYFIFSSPKDDIRIKSIEALLMCYHGKFMEVCKKLDLSINYSYSDLKEDFMKRLAFAFCVAITVFPFTTAQSSETVELNDFLNDSSDDGPKNNQFQSEKFQEGMKKMLPYFIENCVFD